MPCSYCRALREHPGCPAEVRLGIAACRYRLGDPAGATAAYERVLDLDPTSADAMVGLATIKFNAQDVQQVRCWKACGAVQVCDRSQVMKFATPIVACSGDIGGGGGRVRSDRGCVEVFKLLHAWSTQACVSANVTAPGQDPS